MTTPTESSMEHLAPCPLCGGRADAVRVEPAPLKWTRVICQSCGAAGPTWASGKEGAIERWNRRTPTPEAGQTHPIERDAPYFAHVDDEQHAPESARCCFDAGWNAALSQRPSVDTDVREVLRRIVDRVRTTRNFVVHDDGTLHAIEQMAKEAGC